MSTNARLTLIGLYNYMPTLFDALILPEGYNKETFINSLLLEHGEKCVMYSSPDFMRDAIGVWGKKWELELTKIYEALTAKYDPIYNYDRFEEWTDSRDKDYKSTVSGTRQATDKPNYSDSSVHDETDNRSTTGEENRTDKDTNERTVSADNSSAYQPDSKDVTDRKDKTETKGKDDQTIKATTNRTVSGTTQNIDEKTGTSTDDTEKETNTHSAHIYGNVGITTSAQMVTEVLKQRFAYNLYATATRLFANELLIGIY